MPTAKKTKKQDENIENKGESLEKISVEEAFKRVDDVIKAMQEDDISLEDSFHRYKEGMDLLKTAGAMIDRVEKEALKISEDGELEVFEDAKLEKYQCLIETDNGIVDISLDAQFANLTKALRLMIKDT